MGGDVGEDSGLGLRELGEGGDFVRGLGLRQRGIFAGEWSYPWWLVVLEAKHHPPCASCVPVISLPEFIVEIKRGFAELRWL